MKTLSEMLGLPPGFLIIQPNPRFVVSPVVPLSRPANDNADIEVFK